jgi:hypothetical protein
LYCPSGETRNLLSGLPGQTSIKENPMYKPAAILTEIPDNQYIMKSYAIHLFVSIILLIVSEYFFLQEIFGDRQLFTLFLSATGLTLNIAFISYIFKQYKKNYQDS